MAKFMNFFRSNFKQFNNHGYTALEKADEVRTIPGVDEEEMSFFPPAFFRMLEQSFHFTESFVAASLVPDKEINEKQLESLRVFLAAAGFPIFGEIHFTSHFEFVQELFSSWDKTDEIMAEAEEKGITQDFSFASAAFATACEFINGKLSEDQEEFMVLLFLTPLGFACYVPSGITWEKISVGVVVSQEQILNLKPSSVNLAIRTPSLAQREATKAVMPRPVCDFAIIDGVWQPLVSQDMLSFIVRDLHRDCIATIDGNSVDLMKFASSAGLFVGLIGRFSDIMELFQDEERKKLEHQMQNLIPQLFFLKGSGAVSYLILYLPRDFMPNHPQYREVSEYAYTVMRRCCTMTLFVPSSVSVAPIGKVDNHVHGILTQANATEILFHGSRSTQILTVKSQPAVSTVVFEDIDDFLKWTEWLGPQYGFTFLDDHGGVTGTAVRLGKDVVSTLLLHRRQKAEQKSVFDNMLYGIYGDKPPDQLTELQLSDTKTAINIPGLLEKAVHVTNHARSATPQKKCVICDSLDKNISLAEKQDLLREKSEKDLCPKCIVEKLHLTRPANAQELIKIETELVNSMKRSEADFKKLAKELYSLLTPINREQWPAQMFFIEWFWEYWVAYCLESGWARLQEGNRLGLDHFDGVELDSDRKIVNITSAVGILRGKPFTQKDEEYYAYLADICFICPQALDSEQLFNDFRVALLAWNKTRINNREPFPYEKIAAECSKVHLPDLSKQTKGENIEIKSLSVSRSLTVLAETNITTLVHYKFHRVIVSTEESYSAQPLIGEVVATLIEQPEKMVIVNSWNAPNGVLVLTAIGSRLGLVFLENNFYGRCVDHFVYQTNISSTDGLYADYAPRANMLYIVFNDNHENYIAVVQLSLDFLSATEVRRRPLRFLFPLNSYLNSNRIGLSDEPWREPVFRGFIVDESATHAVLSVSVPTEEAHELLVDFDPMTLSVLPLHHAVAREIEIPMIPLHFYRTSQEFDTVVCCSIQPEPETGFHQICVCSPGMTKVIKLSLKDIGSIRSKIGVGEISKQPILVESCNNQPPIFQTACTDLPTFSSFEDMFNVNFDYHAIPKFASKCLANYGLSEIERLAFPSHTSYPVELAKIEVICSTDERCSLPVRYLTESLRASMPTAIPYDWSVPLGIYDMPIVKGKKSFFHLFSPNEKQNYKNMINFVFRLMSLPQMFVSSIPKPIKSLSAHAQDMVSAMAAKLKTRFPALSAMRATTSRNCTVISLVDLGNADGSSILSALTGLPFTHSTKGTFRAGANYVPIFNANASTKLFGPDGLTIDKDAVSEYENVICCSIKADRAGVVPCDVIALYTAVACSDLVVINAGKDTELLISVLTMFIENVDLMDRDYGHLFPHGEDELNVRLAIVTDLGANMDMSVEKLNNIIGSTLSLNAAEITRSIFASGCTYVHSKLSPFEIARSIAETQLSKVVEQWTSRTRTPRTTSQALASVCNSAGMFGGMLSYVDYFMLTGVEDDEVPQSEEESEGQEEEDEEEQAN